MKKPGIVILLCLFISCHKGNNMHVPSNIVCPDSMVQVLTDVHILQATFQLGFFKNDSVQAAHQAFIAVLKKHHLTEKDYNRATRYYSYHPVLLDSIYEKVLDNLSEQRAKLQGQSKH